VSKVLVVDDCEGTCTIIAEFVTRDIPEAIVSTATDGEETLRRVTEDQPSLLILNIIMGGKTGLEVLDEMRADGCDIPVILTSGYVTREELVSRGTLDDERVRFFAKPFTGDELVEAVREILPGEVIPLLPCGASHTARVTRRRPAVTRKRKWSPPRFGTRPPRK